MKRVDRNEIVDVIQSELKKFVSDSLDNEMKKILNKKNSQTRQEMVKILKDGLEAAFKILWIKRDFWKTDIK